MRSNASPRSRHCADSIPGAWWDWPEPWRKPTDEALRQLRESHADEIGFHEFLQWNAERQLERCRDIARGADCPSGSISTPRSASTPAAPTPGWTQGNVLRGLSVGAPPDQFNPAGQDWGLTAYNPHGLVASHFEPFRQMLRAAMRHAGAIRIDHVLGLMRLFVIPHGLPAEPGRVSALPFADMLAVVAEESRRWNCIVIGEDLGTVPENFRATLSAWGVWSYLVVMFERNWDGSFRRPDEYPERAIATFNTHDLATFAGWMSGHDLRTKRAIGVDPGETDDERHRSRVTLCTALGRDRQSQTELRGCRGFSRRDSDAARFDRGRGRARRSRIRSTCRARSTEHPNWRRRWPVPLEELGVRSAAAAHRRRRFRAPAAARRRRPDRIPARLLRSHRASAGPPRCRDAGSCRPRRAGRTGSARSQPLNGLSR